MSISVSVAFTVLGIVISGIVGYFSGRNKDRKEVSNKFENIQKEITDLKLELKNLENRDELQQVVIDSIGKNMNELIPKLFEVAKYKERVDG